ncbi:branched-chain amino acid aminotransferase II [Schizophyllum commune H4-8]|uniref:branched-chain amino acid aminotransferase II n=1 Tax=Schizophyllum commune (strain H4-8 / FGSC 9210) TaxID=578458 RepID=UPI002160302E|nr:branched-chain amino acid aminotransferase II [Schizophyllum commune H4-8]KAI5888294.1 branched-chain amino acid aminotransferase II [Schizophyllum commune H4-8]
MSSATSSELAKLDPSRLVITLASSPKPIPEEPVLGQTMSDHMLICEHDPIKGWGAPEIRPYGPLTLEPTANILQYGGNAFEGLKAYAGPDGRPRLFRVDRHMERLARSAQRASLPSFDPAVLIILLKRLIAVESRWVPAKPGYALYIRPTIISTRPYIGLGASEHAILYIVLTPAAPFLGAGRPISLFAEEQNVRAWPGGTGAYKMGINYAGIVGPQAEVQSRGYDQTLWLFGPDRCITEAGIMNCFVVLRRDDGDYDLITPPLDGTILPGITRLSILELANAHTAGRTVLPGLPADRKIHTHEKVVTMPQVRAWAADRTLLEFFCCGTAVIVVPVGRIWFDGADVSLGVDSANERTRLGGAEADLLPREGGPETPSSANAGTLPGLVASGAQGLAASALGPVAAALRERLVDIQEGRVSWEGWSTVVDAA